MIGNTLRILVFLVVAGASALADDTADARSHEAAAVELLEVMQIEAQMLAGAMAVVDAMTVNAPQMADYRDVFLEWSSSLMTWEVFGPKLVAIYTEAYTESEIREMIAFYRTPTGQKTLRLNPELMSRSAQLGAREAEARKHELQQMIEARRAELERSEAHDD